MHDTVLQAYGLFNTAMEPLGNGLINRTWKVTAGGKQYVLQRINENVFGEPQRIAFNIKLIGDYLQATHPGYRFTRPVAAANGEEMVCVEEGFYRLFPFVEGARTVNVVQTPEQAYEAAAQFGTFTQKLSGFNAAQLQTAIPRFHDLAFRYGRFLQALKEGNKIRMASAKGLIATLLSKKDIVDTFATLVHGPHFKRRVTHHDTKISNVLFDESGKGLCVIDLDTVMPGYFISDAGDMLRTYLSPAAEEEAEFEKIEIREAFYEAVVQGYGEGMKNELTADERRHFVYAGEAMTYMQALRFLTDHLNNDVYYGAAYEGHNLVRATNQLTLLRQLQAKKERLQKLG